jgi:hypothetical protein
MQRKITGLALGLLATMTYWNPVGAVSLANGEDMGLIGTTPITFEMTVAQSDGPLFLFTNDFDVEEPNLLFNLRFSDIENIQFLSTPIFENVTDSEYVASADSFSDELLPDLGIPRDYHLHPQGLVGAGGGSFSMTVWADPVSAVPVPGAVWLFASGLLGLIGVARKQKG